MGFSTPKILASGVAAVLVVPALIFLWAAFGAGLGASEAFGALLAQYTVPRQNLGVVSLVGLLPVALLALVLWILRKLAPEDSRRPLLAAAGLAPVILVVAWIHHGFWTLYLPSRTYPGFPHGLEFVIGPLVFAPVGMAISMVVARLVSRSRG